MQTLHILHLEDDPLDAELILTQLEQDGIACAITRVDTRADYTSALESDGWDIVLADYSLPSFDGLTALDLLLGRGGETPFIFLSGASGEERAIESLKRGATDYVLKQRLDRLAPAVRRALSEAQERTRRRQTEEALKRSEARLRAVIDQMPAGLVIAEAPSGELILGNHESDRIFRHSFIPSPNVEAYGVWKVSHADGSFLPPSQYPMARAIVFNETVKAQELRIERGDGTFANILINAAPILDERGQTVAGVTAFIDITAQKQAEADLRDTNRRLNDTLQSISDAFISMNSEWRLTYINDNAARLLQKPVDAVLDLNFWETFPELSGTRFDTEFHRAIAKNIRVAFEEVFAPSGSTNEFHYECTCYPSPSGLSVYFRDVTENKRQQAEIQNLNVRLQRAMAESHHRIKNNLQVLSALVDMQAINSGELVPVAELRRINQHISSLAALHDMLTQEAKGEGVMDIVSLKTALKKLVPIMLQTAGGRQIVPTIEEAFLPLKKGSAFVLLFNELISNAIKHGKGDIDVSLKVSGQNACLMVSDDGAGFPDGFTADMSANTGLELIESMGRWDLEGSIEYENRDEGGARVVITFPVMAMEPGR